MSCGHGFQICGANWHPFWTHRSSRGPGLSKHRIDPEICHGKPRIRGLRFPVEVVLELLSAGAAIDDILRDYEDLEREDVLPALAFGARLAQAMQIQPPSA